MYAVGEYAL